MYLDLRKERPIIRVQVYDTKNKEGEKKLDFFFLSKTIFMAEIFFRPEMGVVFILFLHKQQ